MKQRTKLIIALSVVVAIVIIASLSTIYAQQLHDQSNLKQNISLTQERLSKVQVDELVVKKSSLESQLTTTKSEFETMKADLSLPVETVSATYKLFEIAASAGVEITEINTPMNSIPDEDLAGLKCSALPINMRIEGPMDNLINCILILNWGLPNGTVENSELEQSKDGENPSASIKLTIYSYKGD